MDSEHLSQLLDRYYRGETSVGEENELRRMLSADGTPSTPEAHAAAAMLGMAEQPHERMAAEIRLHEARPARWRIALVTAASAAIVAVAITLTRPTVYGYVNGRPVTSLAEARVCSESIFLDMRTDGADRTDPLRGLLDIE
ncbi:MAG: hypothetical protein MR292_10390 [Alistipes sp.]|nr:hypothetical protein [Alistipes sp.]